VGKEDVAGCGGFSGSLKETLEDRCKEKIGIGFLSGNGTPNAREGHLGVREQVNWTTAEFDSSRTTN